MSGHGLNEDELPPTNPGGMENKFDKRKTIAQGMFDVALLSSNTNQLVHLLESEGQGKHGVFRLTAISLLIMSIILQVIVGGCLVVGTVSNTLRTDKLMKRRLNIITTLLIFFIAIINVLVPPFTPSYSVKPI